MVLEPVVLPFAQAVARIGAFGPCALAGTGAAAAFETLGANYKLSSVRQPDALWVARGARRMPEAQSVPGPLYLRAPDAKLPGGRSIGQPSEAKVSDVRPNRESLV
jgi:tRNA threonylcarbamoyladenosine biosynthesis protein TsaB